MDIGDLLLAITALTATIIIAVIPLRHDIYDKEAKKYTKPGKWFMALAIIAVISGITLQIRTYIENNKADRKIELKGMD